MGYKLVIAEKDVLARDIARALIEPDPGEGCKLPARGSGWVVCAASGHLLELVEPGAYDERLGQRGGWDVEDLPVRFDDWKKDVKPSRERAADGKRVPDEFAVRKLDVIEGLLDGADEVYHAGDPDDAGQVIVDEILERFGWDGPTWRVYVNDSIAKNIRRAFDERLDNSCAACRGSHDAEYAREMADFTFGINESRLLARKLHLGKLTLGRVQTPTLGLVVERDLAIEGHVKRKYWEVQATCEVDGSDAALGFKLAMGKEHLEDGKRCYDKPWAQECADAVGAASPLSGEVKVRRRERRAPLPYNITQLETDMSRRYGYSVEDTLAITQRLRTEHKAITYNRTDSSYLKTEHWEEAEAVLTLAMGNVGISWPLDFSIKGPAFDDSKVVDHHGIIPTELEVDVSRMSEQERNVYAAIVERYAAQFLSPEVADVYTVECPVEGRGALRHTHRKVTSPGWTAYLKPARGEEDEDERDGEALTPGPVSVRVGRAEAAEHETAPPKPYTPGTLVADMASISKYCEDPEVRRILKEKDAERIGDTGGIGTSATRPAAIAALKKRGYIEEKGGKVRSTPLGRAVWKIVPADIKGADMTARWWLLQEEVRAGRADRNSVARAVCEEFMRHRDTAYAGVELPPELTGKPAAVIVGKCPRCGAPVKLGEKSAMCTSNKYKKLEDAEGFVRTSGCGWRMTRRVGAAPGKKLTERQVASLLAGKKAKVTGIPTKSGKKAEAAASLPKDDGSDMMCRPELEWAASKKKTWVK